MAQVEGYGYIRISRKLYETDPFWLEKRVFSRHEAWEDLIQMAAWKDHSRFIDGSVIELKRGELLASIRFLARRWEWGEKRVRIFLENILEMGRIQTQRETHFGTVYVLVKYEHYNGEGTDEDTPKGTVGAQSGHSRGTKRITSKKGNTGNNTYSAEFLSAWAEYPSRLPHSDKAGAWKGWCARIADGHTTDAMVAGTKRYYAYCFNRGMLGSQFVKDARTFFGPAEHFLAEWKADAATGRKPGEEGSESAAARKDDQVTPSAPRTGAFSTPAGLTDAQQEHEDDVRVKGWSASHKEDAAALYRECVEWVQHTFPMVTLPQNIETQATNKFRLRVLAEKLTPKMAGVA